MRFKRGVGCAALFLISFLLAQPFSSVLAQTPDNGQGGPQSNQAPANSVLDTEKVIERAEASYRLGEEAFKKGQVEAARRYFDQAIDAINSNGIDVRSDSRLDAYYRGLLERIQRHESQPGDERKETTVPAPLDELSKIAESEIATITPDGVKIFGKYDFDFTVAPPVLQFIEYFVAGRGRSTMEIGLQRSGRYRQIAEKAFKEERVPLDLIWLAQAESVWKPNALSRAGAKGIWQFISSTGYRYGLGQSTWVDERSQPEKSTRAAARYLRFLHDYFAGDWLLAMAAYNSGEGRVGDAIARCGYADFWELYKRGLLPSETRNYVPIILSIIIISKNQQRYGFSVKPDPALQYDTFELPSQTDLKVIADLLGVPYEVVQEMNPELRRGASPPQTRYLLRLPKGMGRSFEVAYANLPEDQRIRKILIPRDEASGYRPSYRARVASYRARPGDTLSTVARRYGLSVQELARINGISTKGSIRKGQALKVPVTKVTSKRSSRYKAKAASKSRYSAAKSKAKSSKPRRR